MWSIRIYCRFELRSEGRLDESIRWLSHSAAAKRGAEPGGEATSSDCSNKMVDGLLVAEMSFPSLQPEAQHEESRYPGVFLMKMCPVISDS